ncbi:hypothetical protein GCM10009588_09680 [Microbacterium phyllosphaerae]
MARCTATSASGLTAVDPFTTRDTVDRETPAADATSSMVARIDTTLPPSDSEVGCSHVPPSGVRERERR